MPRYEFLAEHALYAPNASEDENLIDNVVEAKREYRFLYNATMRTKAQILATGLWKQSKNSLIKNGRPKSRKALEIQGYPGLLKSKFSDTTILEPKFFLPDPEKILHPLPDESFLLGIKIKLLTPFYSRDDIVFYPHENPLRREWVFHWPYLSAAGVKGLLRWAWRMCHEDNLLDKEELMFGTRKEEKDEDKIQQGCLYTYPLFWKGSVGLDVINPHSRENYTGKLPIKYEVVKKDAEGVLYLLVFNRKMKKGFIRDIIEPLLNAIDFLLTDTAISAKRTTGWGSVKILNAKFYLKDKHIDLGSDIQNWVKKILSLNLIS